MNPVDALPEDIVRWLPLLGAMQGGGLESLIKAISGLGQVGPKPEFAPGANADTWPRIRGALEHAGLLNAIDTGHTDAPLLRFHADLSGWLAEHSDTGARLETSRNHQRHYFQFAGQLNQRRHREPQASAALTRLELTNLRHAAESVLAQGEEWGLEFVDRLGTLFDDIGEPWQALHEQAERLAERLGGDPWRLRLSNLAQKRLEGGDFAAAEALLQDLLAGLDEAAHFERASAWARIAQCRVQGQRERDARAALFTAAGLCAELARSEAVLEMLRGISLDLIALCDDYEARIWWRKAIDCHAALEATRERMTEFEDFIERIQHACEDSAAARELATELAEARNAGWRDGADAVTALIGGERDLSRLTGELDLDDAALIAEILRRLQAA